MHRGLYFSCNSQVAELVPCCDMAQGWAAANSTSAGGKPFFLGRLDPAEHCMFFDDHISPLDPKIVATPQIWIRRPSNKAIELAS